MTPAALKQARQRLGLTQTGLAQRLGLSLRAIAGYETRHDRDVPHHIALAVEALEARDADPLA